jgi:hypothetical protein
MKTKQKIQTFQQSGRFTAISLTIFSVFLVIDTPDSTHRSPMESMAACHVELRARAKIKSSTFLVVWPYRVVPFAVELGRLEIQLGHLFVGH